MLRKLLGGLVGSIIFLWGLNVVEARELEMESWLYTQGFEEVDPVRVWTVGEHTVNFKGLTEDKAYSGRKSFKLDVTFHESRHFYWSIPVRVPAEGRLQFSGRIFLGAESTSERASLGVNFSFPPTTHSSVRFFGRAEKEEWILVEGNVVKFGKGAVRVIIPGHAWGIEPENVGVYVDRIGLFLWGESGERIVIYVDDIKIKGEVPAEEAYQEEIRRRWDQARARFEEKISSWEKTLRERENKITLLTDLPEKSEELKKEVEARISSLRAKVEKIKERGWINLSEQREIDPLLGQLKGAIHNISLLAERKEFKFKDMLVRVVSPISNLKILPFDTFVRGKISDEIRIIATPGEYEPASFVVSALAEMNLLAEVTDLKGKEGVIPSENVEIKIVKCWFQGDTAWHGIRAGGEPVLIPELLLNDASLVRVDHEKQRNYLRLSFPEGERYVWISDPEVRARRFILPVEEFPVKDSPYLLPVNIPAGRNQQFWVTVKVPDTAPAGVYTGYITLSTEEETLATLTLRLKVLPFTLSPPKTNHNLEQPFVSSIYFTSQLHPNWPEGSISSLWRSEEQLRAELKNMFSHGITNPNVYQGKWQLFDERLLEKHLTIREEVGMGGQPLFFLGVGASAYPSQIKRTIEFIKPFGTEEVYFMGLDEARGERLIAQREAWEATRKAGGRIFVAGYIGSNFPKMGDIQNLQISAWAPCKEEAARWHSVEHRIFSYANPQAGPENPEVFRRNFGLLLWLHNYDGAMTYAFHSSFGNAWNDFDHPRFRDHNLVYPTVDGVITTIALAGYREGVDDIRYATTLRLAIREAKRSGDSRLREKAAEAERYLEELDVDRDLDTIRLEIIGHILRLKGGR